MVREAIQRYAREVAFAAATVYAQAAEMRGAWDARLEALVVDSVIRGEADESVRSRASALGWTGAAGTTGSAEVAVVVGRAPATERDTPTWPTRSGTRPGRRVLTLCARCRATGWWWYSVVRANLSRSYKNSPSWFGPGPIVVGPVVKDLMAAVTSARAAVAGLRAAPAWPGAPATGRRPTNCCPNGHSPETATPAASSPPTSTAHSP